MYNLNNKLLKLPKDGSALMSGRSFFPLTLAIKKVNMLIYTLNPIVLHLLLLMIHVLH